MTFNYGWDKLVYEPSTILFLWEIGEITKGELPKPENIEPGLEMTDQLLSKFRRNKIYFNSGLAQKIETLIEEVQGYLLRLQSAHMQSKIPETMLLELNKKGHDIISRIERLFSEIETEFRDILGVNSSLVEGTL